MRTGFTILRQLSNKYRIYLEPSWRHEKDPEDRKESKLWCQEIRGHGGIIHAYGYDGSLKCYTTITHRGKELCRILGGRVDQDGDYELTFVFAPRHLDQVAAFIGAEPSKSAQKKAPRGRPFVPGNKVGLAG